MIFCYGKIKKFLDKTPLSSDISNTGDRDILDMLETREVSHMSVLVMFATDYALVGAVSKRLREAVDALDAPLSIIIVSETENLLANKMPSNPNVRVIIEKSKKPETLYDQIKRCINTPLVPYVPEIESVVPGIMSTDFGVQELIEESGPISDIREELSPDTPVDIPDVNVAMPSSRPIVRPRVAPVVETAPQSVVVPEVVLQPAAAIAPTVIQPATPTPQPVTQTPPVIKETIVEKIVVRSLYDLEVHTLPKYAPLRFSNPSDVLHHLRTKWNLDVIS